MKKILLPALVVLSACSIAHGEATNLPSPSTVGLYLNPTNFTIVGPTNAAKFRQANDLPSATDYAATSQAVAYVAARTGGYDVAAAWVPAHSAAVAYVEGATGGYDVASAWVPAHSAAVAYVEGATAGYDVASAWVPAHSAAVAYVEGRTAAVDRAEAWVDANTGNVFMANGAVPATGDWNLDGHSITNVGTNIVYFSDGSKLYISGNDIFFISAGGTTNSLADLDAATTNDLPTQTTWLLPLRLEAWVEDGWTVSNYVVRLDCDNGLTVCGATSNDAWYAVFTSETVQQSVYRPGDVYLPFGLDNITNCTIWIYVGGNTDDETLLMLSDQDGNYWEGTGTVVAAASKTNATFDLSSSFLTNDHSCSVIDVRIGHEITDGTNGIRAKIQFKESQ